MRIGQKVIQWLYEIQGGGRHLRFCQNTFLDVRIVFHVHAPSHSCQFLRRRVTRFFASITYRACHSSQPVYLRDLLINYQPAKTLRASNSHLLLVPKRVKTVTASGTFGVVAPTIWNNLPMTVKTAESFNVFKRSLKCHLFDAAFIH